MVGTSRELDTKEIEKLYGLDIDNLTPEQRKEKLLSGYFDPQFTFTNLQTGEVTTGDNIQRLAIEAESEKLAQQLEPQTSPEKETSEGELFGKTALLGLIGLGAVSKTVTTAIPGYISEQQKKQLEQNEKLKSVSSIPMFSLDKTFSKEGVIGKSISLGTAGFALGKSGLEDVFKTTLPAFDIISSTVKTVQKSPEDISKQLDESLKERNLGLIDFGSAITNIGIAGSTYSQRSTDKTEGVSVVDTLSPIIQAMGGGFIATGKDLEKSRIYQSEGMFSIKDGQIQYNDPGILLSTAFSLATGGIIGSVIKVGTTAGGFGLPRIFQGSGKVAEKFTSTGGKVIENGKTIMDTGTKIISGGGKSGGGGLESISSELSSEVLKKIGSIGGISVISEQGIKIADKSSYLIDSLPKYNIKPSVGEFDFPKEDIINYYDRPDIKIDLKEDNKLFPSDVNVKVGKETDISYRPEIKITGETKYVTPELELTGENFGWQPELKQKTQQKNLYGITLSTIEREIERFRPSKEIIGEREKIKINENKDFYNWDPYGDRNIEDKYAFARQFAEKERLKEQKLKEEERKRLQEIARQREEYLNLREEEFQNGLVFDFGGLIIGKEQTKEKVKQQEKLKEQEQTKEKVKQQEKLRVIEKVNEKVKMNEKLRVTEKVKQNEKLKMNELLRTREIEENQLKYDFSFDSLYGSRPSENIRLKEKIKLPNIENEKRKNKKQKISQFAYDFWKITHKEISSPSQMLLGKKLKIDNYIPEVQFMGKIQGEKIITSTQNKTKKQIKTKSSKKKSKK